VSSRFKVFIQYLIILSVTVLLVWFSLRSLQNAEGFTGNKWDYLRSAWSVADKGWLTAMAVVAIASHLLRAKRWQMLMVPSGHHSKLSHTFFSLMVGYLVNLVIPRGGEVSRCYNLYKLDKTPVQTSFGTVVTERIIDVICLLVLIGFSFALESKKLFKFIETLPLSPRGQSGKIWGLVIIFSILLVLGLGGYLLIKKNKKINAFIMKTVTGFKEGLLSIFKLKNKKLFIFYSVVIWLLYFLMSYTVIMAFPTTSELGFNAVLSLFAIGAIAMTAPLPGGTGAYHVLVPQGLVFLYGIPQTDAVAFTFIFHGWQTLILILCGAISLLITSVIIKNQSAKALEAAK
jgi:glycosyltransferase 2 family protein